MDKIPRYLQDCTVFKGVKVWEKDVNYNDITFPKMSKKEYLKMDFEHREVIHGRGKRPRGKSISKYNVGG